MTERLAKIYALYKRGTPGEQQAAEHLLTTMLAKEHLTLADYELAMGHSEEINEYYQGYGNRWDKELVVQVFRMVTNDNEENGRGLYRRKGSRSLLLRMSLSEKIEFDVHYHVYTRELGKGFDEYLHAFFVKNMICSQKMLGEIDKNPKKRTLSQKQMQDRFRLHNLMNGMDRTHVRKQVEKGEA